MARADGARAWDEFRAGADGSDGARADGAAVGGDGHVAMRRLSTRVAPLLRTLLREWGAEHDGAAVEAAWNELLVELLVRGGKAEVDAALAAGATLDDALRPCARRAASRASKLQRKGRPPRRRKQPGDPNASVRIPPPQSPCHLKRAPTRVRATRHSRRTSPNSKRRSTA